MALKSAPISTCPGAAMIMCRETLPTIGQRVAEGTDAIEVL